MGILRHALRLPLRPRHSRCFRRFPRAARHQNGLPARRNRRLGARTTLMLVLPFLGIPVGLPAAAIAALLIARRVCAPRQTATFRKDVGPSITPYRRAASAMATIEISNKSYRPGAPGKAGGPDRIRTAVAHAAFLATFWVDGLSADKPARVRLHRRVGRRQLASAGHAASVYDWGVHKLDEQTTVGHPFAGCFGFHYPPTFLFVAVALSLLSYGTAYTVWALRTFRRI